MILKSEIRVGNMYNRKHGKGWSYTTIDERIIGGIFSERVEYALNDFEPLPIDTKWLELMEFTKHGESLWSLGNICIQIDKDGIFSWIATPEPWFPFSKLNLKYVHEIQNLHHALTGEELT